MRICGRHQLFIKPAQCYKGLILMELGRTSRNRNCRKIDSGVLCSPLACRLLLDNLTQTSMENGH